MLDRGKDSDFKSWIFDTLINNMKQLHKTTTYIEANMPVSPPIHVNRKNRIIS